VLACFSLGLQLPLFNLVGNVNCPATVIEKILNEGKYDSNCSSSLDPLMVALAFDRRPILGNSLSPLTYDILAQLSLILIAILTPMRIVTIVNCANRALRALTAAHFSPRRSTFDAEAFFSDFRIVNNLLVRIQRSLRAPSLLPHHHASGRTKPLCFTDSWAFKFCWLQCSTPCLQFYVSSKYNSARCCCAFSCRRTIFPTDCMWSNGVTIHCELYVQRMHWPAVSFRFVCTISRLRNLLKR
jgi:hypothetical protein